MPQLLPDGLGDPSVEEPVSQAVVSYGESWEFHLNPECDCTDPLQQIPHLSVRGKQVQRVTEARTLEQWLRMALAVERFRWEIYDNQYGTEFTELIEGSLPEVEAESEVVNTIREAILVDPRVASVTSVGIVEGRDLGDPSAFVVEVRVVTFTGEQRLLRLDLSEIRTTNASLYT